MKCKICGARLSKDGDICRNCYEEKVAYELSENDTNEILKFKRKYLPAYEVMNYLDLIIIFSIVVISLVASQTLGYAALFSLIFIAIIAGILLLKKRISIGTKITFYETKVRYNFDFAFFHNEKIIKYSDIKDISYFQTRRQKKYNLADLCVYVKYTGLIGGINFKNLPNAEENLKKIKEVVFKSEE